LLKWDVVPSQSSDGQRRFELRLQCGLEIMRLPFLTGDDVRELKALLEGAGAPPDEQRADPVQPGPVADDVPEPPPGRTAEISEPARPPDGEEGVVSDPDVAARR